MIAETLKEQFQLQRDDLPGSDDVRRARAAALDAFTAKGFPTRRDEAWRYTDLKPIATGSFDFSPARLSESARASAAALLAEAVEAADAAACPRAVFVDGRLDEALSRLDGPAGLAVSTLAADWQRPSVRPARAGLEGHPLAALNTAFARDGVAVRARAGAAVEAPLHLFFVGSGASNFALQPRVSIALEPNAALTVVVHCIDAGEPLNWLNLVTEIALAEGSRLTLYRLQEHATSLYHTSLLRAELAKDASLELGYVDVGGRLARNDIDVRLAEPGASATLFGVFVAGAGQHIDDHIRVEHAAAHTTSDEAFRGIADGDGRGVFNGKVIVERDAQRIDAKQSSDNLLLSDRAEIDTKPELEIYADDVKCSHGATVGELDPEHLFYLRSRGIDEEAARGLLTFAFANSILRRIGIEALRERATARVGGHLPDRGQWEELA